MNFVKMLFATIWLLFFSSVIVAEEIESGWYVDALLTQYVSKHADSQSLTGKELLIISPSHTSGFGGYVFTYHDEEFHNYFAGVTYTIENESVGFAQFGLGYGKAVFKDYDSFPTINPWIFWQPGLWTINLYSEYIPDEIGSDKWFWKADISRKFHEESSWSVGVYHEKNNGIGPKVAYEFENGFYVWGSKPFKSDYNNWILAAGWSITF